MRIQKSILFFVPVAVIFFALFYAVENNNDSFLLNDFKVYYSASEALIEDGKPYGVAYGLSSGYFKYSPITLFLFSPYTLFSFEAAKTIHFIVIALFSTGVFFLILNLCSAYFGQKVKKRSGFLCLLLLLSAVHLTRELHLGNINMLLLFFFLTAIYLLHEGKHYQSAFFWTLVIFLKPYFLILLLPVFIAKNWRLMLTIVGYSVLFLLLPALFIGFDENLSLLADWLITMRDHTAGGFSEHTFSSIFTSYTGVKLPGAAQYVFIALTGIIYLVIRSGAFTAKQIYTRKTQLFDFFILIALVPNLVITDSQHFLFSLPLIGLILSYIKLDMRWYYIAAFTVLWFFYGANSNDLLGNPLSDKFDTFSTIGVANLGLIVMLILMDRRFYREDITASS